jgi:uncharacterized protein
MRLDLARISGPTQHIEREYPSEAFGTGEDEYRVVTPVRLAFDVHKSENRYRLVGRVTAGLRFPCSRCTEPFEFPVDAEFDLTYLPQSRNTGEGEFEVAEEDLGVAFYEDEAVDLGQLMREQFYLAIPMKPLCRADCQGLCPECGVNRNTTACACAKRWEDPRLAGLRRLVEGAPPAKD